MSFNSKNENKSIPLIDEKIQDTFNKLQTEYINFIKIFDEIYNYDLKLANISRKEYDKIKDDIQQKIQLLPNQINSLDDIIEKLSNRDYKDQSFKIKVSEQIKIINEKIIPKKLELPNLLNSILEKENIITKRISVTSLNTNTINESDPYYDRMNSFQSNSSFVSSKLVIKDIIDEDNYLKKRQQELEDIKKVSSQIKDITNCLNNEVKTQGDGLKSIENNVSNVLDDVKKAEFEIDEAEKISRGNSKRMWIILCLIFFFMISIMTILLLIFLGDRTKE